MTTEKLVSINLGNQSGEVYGGANAINGTVTFFAKINGKTVAEGPVFDDVREVIVRIFTPRPQ